MSKDDKRKTKKGSKKTSIVDKYLMDVSDDDSLKQSPKVELKNKDKRLSNSMTPEEREEFQKECTEILGEEAPPIDDVINTTSIPNRETASPLITKRKSVDTDVIQQQIDALQSQLNEQKANQTETDNDSNNGSIQLDYEPDEPVYDDTWDIIDSYSDFSGRLDVCSCLEYDPVELQKLLMTNPKYMQAHAELVRRLDTREIALPSRALTNPIFSELYQKFNPFWEKRATEEEKRRAYEIRFAMKQPGVRITSGTPKETTSVVTTPQDAPVLKHLTTKDITLAREKAVTYEVLTGKEASRRLFDQVTLSAIDTLWDRYRAKHGNVRERSHHALSTTDFYEWLLSESGTVINTEDTNALLHKYYTSIQEGFRLYPHNNTRIKLVEKFAALETAYEQAPTDLKRSVLNPDKQKNLVKECYANIIFPENFKFSDNDKSRIKSDIAFKRLLPDRYEPGQNLTVEQPKRYAQGEKPTTVEQFKTALLDYMDKLSSATSELGVWWTNHPGPTTKNPNPNPNPSTKKRSSVFDNKAEQLKKFKGDKRSSSGVAQPAPSRKDTDGSCYVCGKKHLGGCRYFNHQQRNKENKPWAESTQGKAFKAKGIYSLPDGEYVNTCTCISCYTMTNNTSNNVTINMFINTNNRCKERITALLDTGATSSNFINKKLVDKLVKINKEKFIVVTNDVDSNVVCSAFNKCVLINKEIIIELFWLTEFNKQTSKLLKFRIAEIGYDIVIGRPEIQNSNIILQFPSLFFSGKELRRLRVILGNGLWERYGDFSTKNKEAIYTLEGLDSTSADTRAVATDILADSTAIIVGYDYNTSYHIATESFQKQIAKATTSKIFNPDYLALLYTNKTLSSTQLHTMSVNNNSTNFSQRSAYERENLTELDNVEYSALPCELFDTDNTQHYTNTTNNKTLLLTDERLPSHIEGTLEFREKARKMLTKHVNTFSRTVNPKPAKVPAFELIINEDEWRTNKNRLGPRKMDLEKQKELDILIQKALDANLIRISSQPFVSMVFLVPKPNGKWRLVQDFIRLNKLTSNSESWPIPNIKDMLYRIGAKRPRYFAVLDLTSGYHQMAIAENSRRHTAFITSAGVYEWLRLPMGLKGAGSFFQRTMATEVLGGLVKVCCELYLDDILVYGSTEDEFLNNLSSILERLQSKNMTINPDKCQIGLSQITYVGHTIDKEGIHFDRDKLDGILDIKLPLTQKHMKSFLGVANWYRDHVEQHSLLAQPLQQLITPYHKSKKISWTEELKENFERLKRAVNQCPKLFFLDDTSPIFLDTDASDYGFGATLYQKRIENDVPIGFISKAFDERQLKWDTPQKEGFAIFYALDKWDYLLRDRRFTLRTDHANLTLLKTDKIYSTNKKVQRWLSVFQGYDYDIQFVKGSSNQIADAFSRLSFSNNNNEIESICIASELEMTRIPPREHALIAKVHNSTVGHHGVETTLHKLAKAGHLWPNMKQHVKAYIKRCACCQKMNILKPVINSLKFTVSKNSPMEEIAIDLIEDLIPDNKGNKFILVIIDSFSRYVSLYPLPSKGAEDVAQGLIWHVGLYGSPASIRSDKGGAFISDVIKSLTNHIGSSLTHTSAYSKQENAIVERANKEIMRHLRNIIFEKRVIKEWSLYLPLVQRIMNASIHQSIGIAPATLVYGNGIDLDRGIFLNHLPGTNDETSVSKWVDQMTHKQAVIIDIARQHLQKTNEAHLMTQKSRATSYPVGSVVLAEHRGSWRKGPKSKLLPYKKGPLRVISSRGDKYVLQDLVTQKASDYHIKDISPFLYDNETQDPLNIALRDERDSYHIVDYIEKVIGDLRGPKTKLKFKVHWKDSAPSIEKYNTIKTTEAFIKFARNHWNKNIKALAPKNIELEKESNTKVTDSMDLSSDEEPVAEDVTSSDDEAFNAKQYWRA